MSSPNTNNAAEIQIYFYGSLQKSKYPLTPFHLVAMTSIASGKKQRENKEEERNTKLLEALDKKKEEVEDEESLSTKGSH